MASLLIVAFAAGAAVFAQSPAPAPISDEELARIAAAPFDRDAKMFNHDVLGTHHDMIVLADYPCGDVCPDYTVRIVHYDRPAGPGCEAAGGVSVRRTVPQGPASHIERFCVPRVVAAPAR